MRFGLRLMFVATTMSAIVLGVGWPLYRSYTEEFVVYSKGVTVGAEWGWIESTEMLASKANATFIFGNARIDLPSRLDGENLAYLVVVSGESNVEGFWSGVAPDGINQRRALAKCTLDDTPIRMEYCVSVDWEEQLDAGAMLSTKESLAIERATFDLQQGRLIFVEMLDGNVKATQARLPAIPAEIFKSTNLGDDKARIEKALRWWASNMPERLRPKGPFGT